MSQIETEGSSAKAFEATEATLSTRGFVVLMIVCLFLALLILAGERKFSHRTDRGTGINSAHSATANEQRCVPNN